MKKSDRRIVLDLETKRSFDDVGGRNNLEKLEVSVVGVYDYQTNQYQSYEEKDLGLLQNLLIDASLVIGFNHVFFDMKVLQPYLSIPLDKLPHFDIMLDLQKRLNHRIGLDAIASATLGIGKTGSGLDAIRYFHEGRMDELKAYCLNDVKVTKEICDFGLKHKKIFYTSKFGQVKKEIAVDWSAYNSKKAEKINQEQPLEQAQYKLF